MRTLLISMLLTGCGRFAFDAAPDAAVSGACDGIHDEDGDGVVDGCDVCPHLAGPQDDRDGDGVGDACDPNPDIARDRIALFDPFTEQSTHFERLGQAPYSFDGESLVFAGAMQTDFLTYLTRRAASNDTFEVGIDLDASNAAEQRQLSFWIGPPTDPASFYCDLNDPTGAAAFWAQVYTYDGVDYTSDLGGPATTPFEHQTFFVRTQVTSDGAWTCTTSYPAFDTTIVGTYPPDIPRDAVGFGTQNVDIRVTYFVHIDSD